MVISAIYLFSYWPPAEPLPGAHGTLRFCGTPVENTAVLTSNNYRAVKQFTFQTTYVAFFNSCSSLVIYLFSLLQFGFQNLSHSPVHVSALADVNVVL